MKNLIIILIVLVANSAMGQTQTEKYNSILNRYEFFDGQKMIGYKVYNSILDQWEYTDLTKNDNVNDDQPHQSPYRHLQPIQTFNETAVYKTLAIKEERHENNVAQIQQLVNDLSFKLEEISNIQKRELARNEWNRLLENFNSKNSKLDYSSSQRTQSVKDYFIKSFNKIIKNANAVASKSNIWIQTDLIDSKRFRGGYRTSQILEANLNSETGKWEANPIQNKETQFYLSELGIYWKIGDRRWNFSRWDYISFDTSNKKHRFLDDDGNTIQIDDALTLISWWTHKNVEGKWTKNSRFSTLVKDNSVTPEF